VIKSKFSIKDLENLSGIKAHTIRIWEKRYNLLSPTRTDTNIRTYNLEALQKILNVSYLKNLGSKISTISDMDNDQIEKEVRKHSQDSNLNDHSIQRLKLAMINFDQTLFQTTYDQIYGRDGFSAVFYELFIPFLEELGYLWQSKTINIAHEHFISSLIKQKMHVNIEKLQYQDFKNNEEAYILFLPENEMHDLGLLFVNYQLLLNNKRTIYLGESMLLDALKYFKTKESNPIYITYLTVYPTEKKLPSFLKKFHSKIQEGNDSRLWLLGHQSRNIKNQDLFNNQSTFKNIAEAMKEIPKLVSA
jgi:DNA-binding transcriptional MerR regulator